MALPGGSLTPASDHPVWQGGWHRQSPWQPSRTSSPEASSLGYGVPSHARTQGNEVVSEELLQESDCVTSCKRGCTTLHKPGHTDLVWGDHLG